MSTLEAKFVELETEWRAISADLRTDLVRWEQQFGELEREENRLRDEGRWMAGRSDFLGVLGWQRDELAHSRMIAWLLDPCARHRLGSRVLEGVLEELFGSCPHPGLGRARTRCEVPLLNGRLDIVVEAPGLHLVIENKIDAEEGEDQCSYYSTHLPEGALCVMLSPDGRQARSAPRFSRLLK